MIALPLCLCYNRGVYNLKIQGLREQKSDARLLTAEV